MILLNKIGYISSGDMKSFYLKIVHDTEKTGGYYILFSRDFSDFYAEGYDEWYLNLEELTDRFNDFNVEWIS